MIKALDFCLINRVLDIFASNKKLCYSTSRYVSDIKNDITSDFDKKEIVNSQNLTFDDEIGMCNIKNLKGLLTFRENLLVESFISLNNNTEYLNNPTYILKLTILENEKNNKFCFLIPTADIVYLVSPFTNYKSKEKHNNEHVVPLFKTDEIPALCDLYNNEENSFSCIYRNE